MDRIPTDYNRIEGLTILDSADLNNLEIRARSMTLEECLETLFLTLDDLSEKERVLVSRVHRRGRNLGVQKACDSLFSQMKVKGGTQACIDYLRSMSATFAAEETPTSIAGGGFSFTVHPSAEQSKKTSNDRSATVTNLPRQADSSK